VNSLLYNFFQEIIEFPCIKINADTCEIEDVFHQYIQPKEIPVITPYCTELTGIIQVNFKHFFSLICSLSSVTVSCFIECSWTYMVGQ